jgi:hypothetical protein
MICPLGYCNNPNCPKKAACNSQKRLYQSRAIQSQSQAIAQKKKDNNQQFRGVYIGYNTQTRLCTVRLSNGSLIPCQPITTGFIVPGQIVTGILPKNGSYGIINGIPN